MQGNPLIEFGLPISLMLIMAGMGLSLTLRDFHQVVVYPRAMVLGSLGQVAILPLLAFGLIALLDLPPMLAVGLVVIAGCPGGTTSNVFTYFARGTLALSITLTVIASIVTVFTIPLFVNLALDFYTAGSPDEPLRLPVLETIVRLLIIIVLPVAVGMIVRAWAPRTAARLERATGIFGLVVLAALIILIVIQVRSQIGSLLAQAGPAAIILNLVGIALGFAFGKVPGISHRDALTIAVELGIKNGTLGLMVTLTLLGNEQMAIPSAVYGVLMFIFGGALIAYGRKRFPPAAVEAKPA